MKLTATTIVMLGFARAVLFAADPTTDINRLIRDAQLASDAFSSLSNGDYDKAEQNFQELVDKHPDTHIFHFNLGVARYRAGKYKLAAESLLRAIQLQPKDADSHRLLGVSLYALGHTELAIEGLLRALALNNKDARARASIHRYLAAIAVEKGWHEAATEELEKAEEIEKLQKLLPQTVPEIGDYFTPLEKGRLQLPGEIGA